MGSTPMTFTLGLRSLARGGHARGQSAAADGHQNHVHVGQGLEIS